MLVVIQASSVITMVTATHALQENSVNDKTARIAERAPADGTRIPPEMEPSGTIVARHVCAEDLAH